MNWGIISVIVVVGIILWVFDSSGPDWAEFWLTSIILIAVVSACIIVEGK